MQFRSDIFWRSARGNCPDCAKPIELNADRPWYQRLVNIPAVCAACGMTLRRKEGFFLGAMVWNYTLTAFGVLPLVLLASSLGWISHAHAIEVAVVAIFVVPPFIHALSWRLWIGTYYAFLPDQLPSSGRRLDD